MIKAVKGTSMPPIIKVVVFNHISLLATKRERLSGKQASIKHIGNVGIYIAVQRT